MAGSTSGKSSERVALPKWVISGAYLDSGEDVEMVIEAATETDAARVANKRGIAVSSIDRRPEDGGRMVPVPRSELVSHPVSPPTGYRGAVPLGHATSAPTINVNLPIRSNSMALAGFVIGIVVLVPAFIPIVNFIAVFIAAVGLLLAFVGLLGCGRRGGIGYAIGGIVLNVIAILPTLVLLMGLGAAAAGAAEQARKEQEAREASRAAMAEAVRNSGASRPESDSAAPRSSPASEPTDAADSAARVAAPNLPAESTSAPVLEKPKAQPIGLGKEFRMGDAAVVVTKVIRGKVPLSDKIRHGSSTSKDDLLAFEISIRNASDTKRLNYATWNGSGFSLSRDYATLSDNFENPYKRIDFGFATEVVGASDESEMVNPGDIVTDVLVFELPIAKAEWLELSLAAANVGAKEDVTVFVKLSDVEIRPIPGGGR